MLKKTITYTDYNGEERTEDFYFNISKAEAAEMELTTTGGLTKEIEEIIAAKDNPSIVKLFKSIILKAYGKKSPDGKRFIKSEELSKEFSETEAYSNLFMELASDEDAASAFINGVLSSLTPQDHKPKTVVPMRNAEKPIEGTYTEIPVE